jgi:short-subunit dehydrogenase
VTQTFLPALARSKGAIVNVLSLASLAAVPFDSLYSISKAAAFSLSQSLRALSARDGMSVHVTLPGPIDTGMARGLDIPKASAESVARAILDGVEKDEEEIFPDPMSAAIAEGWRGSALKALQRQFAAYVEQKRRLNRRRPKCCGAAGTSANFRLWRYSDLPRYPMFCLLNAAKRT